VSVYSRTAAISPTPLYAWSLIWLSQDRHPLPAHDQAELQRLEHLPAPAGLIDP
jgi:hypothetical protein